MPDAIFEILEGPQKGRRVEITGRETLIGRDQLCDLSLPNYSRVSRRHARLRRQGYGYYLEDIGSTNGTRVNDEKITGRFLIGGERLQLGDCVAVLHVHKMPAIEPHESTFSPNTPQYKKGLSHRVAVGVGLLLFLIGIPLLGSFRGKPHSAEIVLSPGMPTQAVPTISPASKNTPASQNTSPLPPLLPTDPVNGKLSPQGVTNAKNAAVFIVHEDFDGYVTGSGFAVGDGSQVVSNRHVVVDSVGRPLPCFLIFHSGTPQQQMVKIDADQIRLAQPSKNDDGFRGDLAVITLNAPLVAGLPLGKTEDLTETDGVYAVGFPLGTQTLTLDGQLPSVSIKAETVERIQREMIDGTDTATVLQLGGTVTKGNSGGPVINNQGEIVGVISRGALGTGMAYAIPTTFIQGLLR